MKARHLVAIFSVLLILIAIGILVRRRPTPTSTTLSGQVEIVRLLDDDFSEAAVTGIVISRNAAPAPSPGKAPGGDAEEKAETVQREVRLVRDDDGKWRVATSHSAPANATKIGDLLVVLRGLKGDLQAERKASHAGLGVDDDNALRIELTTGDGRTAVILAGERAGGVYGESYVRRGGEDKVYRVDQDVRRAAGMTSTAIPAPSARDWLDLTLADTPIDAMRRVIISYPGRRLVIVRDVDESGSPASWKLEEGGLAEKFKAERMVSWTSAASLINAEDAAEPSLADKGEAATEPHSLTIEAENRPDFILGVFSRDDVWYAVASTRPGLVYSLTTGNQSRLFPKIEEFFQEEPVKKEESEDDGAGPEDGEYGQAGPEGGAGE
ncbi:MAG: DUF4340 domain-containing protein [Planctomycetota bacterium]|nr:DUF4340 domain-containing protein [Planctomycetota bacterium]